MADTQAPSPTIFQRNFLLHVTLRIEKSSATQTENVEENLWQRGSFQPERKEKIIILIENCWFRQQGTRVNAIWQLQFSTVFTDEKLSLGCIPKLCVYLIRSKNSKTENRSFPPIASRWWPQRRDYFPSEWMNGFSSGNWSGEFQLLHQSCTVLRDCARKFKTTLQEPFIYIHCA